MTMNSDSDRSDPSSRSETVRELLLEQWVVAARIESTPVPRQPHESNSWCKRYTPVGTSAGILTYD